MSEIFEENTKHFRTLNEKHEIDKLNSIGIDNLDDKQKKRITELYKNFADLLVKSSYLSAYEMLSDVDSITPINKDIIEDFKKESDLSVKHEKYNNIYQIINQKRLKDFLIYTELIYTSLKFFFSIDTAAIVSRVGVSPQHAITISGSDSGKVLAKFQIPIPFLQCSIASFTLNHCGLGCLDATITFISFFVFIQ